MGVSGIYYAFTIQMRNSLPNCICSKIKRMTHRQVGVGVYLLKIVILKAVYPQKINHNLAQPPLPNTTNNRCYFKSDSLYLDNDLLIPHISLRAYCFTSNPVLR